MPIPPTSSEIPAIQASRMVIMSVVELIIGAHLLLRPYFEVVVFALLDFVILAQNLGNLVDSLRGEFLGQGRAEDALQVGDGQYPLLHRGVGGQHHVVLVHAHAVVALGGECAHNLERILSNRITLPIGFSPLGKRLSMMVCPTRQTLAEVSTSCGVNMLPSSMENLRISR